MWKKEKHNNDANIERYGGELFLRNGRLTGYEGIRKKVKLHLSKMEGNKMLKTYKRNWVCVIWEAVVEGNVERETIEDLWRNCAQWPMHPEPE